MWAFDTQDVAHFHRWFRHAKNAVGEQPAGCVSNVQLDERIIMRRVGHGETAPLAVFQQKFDVLPRLKLQPIVCGQLEAHDGDVIDHAIKMLNAAWQRLHNDVAGFAHITRFNGDVPHGTRHAKQRFSLEAFKLWQGGGLVVSERDDAVNDASFARTTRAIFAAVWNEKARS